jgi:sugar O-acyltransferase (sialic acid O-acetyltransferase NeuD family)
MEIIIIGAGGFAKQIIEVCELSNIKIRGLVDDFTSHDLFNYPILGNVEYLTKLLLDEPQLKIFCSIGDVNVRKRIFNLFPQNFINCIHPNSTISKYHKMGMGNYIGPNACIMPNVTIGDNNIIDTLAVVCHDSQVSDHNHLATHSCLLGRVIIENCNLIGANSTILPNLTLGSNNILGAGAVLTKNKEDNFVLIGIPAKEYYH